MREVLTAIRKDDRADQFGKFAKGTRQLKRKMSRASSQRSERKLKETSSGTGSDCQLLGSVSTPATSSQPPLGDQSASDIWAAYGLSTSHQCDVSSSSSDEACTIVKVNEDTIVKVDEDAIVKVEEERRAISRPKPNAIMAPSVGKVVCIANSGQAMMAEETFAGERGFVCGRFTNGMVYESLAPNSLLPESAVKKTLSPKGIEAGSGGDVKEGEHLVGDAKKSGEGAIVGDIRIVNRQGTEKKRAESYIVDGKGVYVVGQTSARTPNFKKNIEIVASAIREGICTTKGAARELLAAQEPSVTVSA